MEWSNGKITIKGDASEMLYLFKGTNADTETLLPMKDSRIKMKWFVIWSIFFLVLSCITWSIYDSSNLISGIMSIILLAMIAVTAISCHLSLKNKVVTLITGFACSVIFMVSIHVFTPEDAGKEVKGKIDKVISSEIDKNHSEK